MGERVVICVKVWLFVSKTMRFSKTLDKTLHLLVN